MLTPNIENEFLARRRKDAKKTPEQYVAPLRLCGRMILVSLLVLSCGVMAFAQQRAMTQSDANAMFRSARDLITDGDWAKAQEKFSEYVNTYPNEKNLEAALYWLPHTPPKQRHHTHRRTAAQR